MANLYNVYVCKPVHWTLITPVRKISKQYNIVVEQYQTVENIAYKS